MTDSELKELAKDMVMHCFRNTHLESIHAGSKCGGVGSGFSDKEMKKLMIESVNNTYTFLYCLQNRKFSKSFLEYVQRYKHCHRDWNEPEIVSSFIETP